MLDDGKSIYSFSETPVIACQAQQKRVQLSRTHRSTYATAEAKEGTVPLSDREQQLLDQIEQALYAEDPKFATTVRSARPRSHQRRWLVLCLFGVVAGLAIVLGGLVSKSTTVEVILGVVGFILIVASCVYATTLLTSRNASANQSSAANAANAARKDGVRSRMEDRLKRRFDEN